MKAGLESLLSIHLFFWHCGRTTQHGGAKERLCKSSMEGLDKATESNMKTEDSGIQDIHLKCNVSRLCPHNIFVYRTI